MIDREKVIKGLEHCSEDGCKECPYEQDCTMADGFSELASDALALLKEQEKRINELEEKLRLLEYGDKDILESGLRLAT